MNSAARVIAFLGATALALPASAQKAPPAPRPPSAPAAPASATPAPVAAPAAPAAPVDLAAVAPGVVILERAGKFLALGTILNGDGRVVTALSPLAGGQHLDVRYADGALVPARLGHADRNRDLALVVPQNSRHKLGLRASRKALTTPPPSLKSFAPAGQRVVAGATLTTVGPSTFLGVDGKPLPDAISFSAPVPAGSVGSPLLDESGEAVGLVARACRRVSGSGCTPALAGIPVNAVRDFLQKAPASAALPVAWLGVEGQADDSGTARGVRVSSSRGPALAAGLRAGQDARSADLIVALDGVPVTTPEALAQGIEARSVGDLVDLLVLGAGRFRHVTLVLSAAPAPSAVSR
ncbi:MAG TPA: S1C family serine protease [Polyangiaceae bacterium]